MGGAVKSVNLGQSKTETAAVQGIEFHVRAIGIAVGINGWKKAVVSDVVRTDFYRTEKPFVFSYNAPKRIN
jgi:hypothetical protein